MALKKDRWFAIVTYVPLNTLKRVIECKGQYIRAWAYCIHDKDKTAPHIHVLLRTYQSYTFNAIRNWFNDCRVAVDKSNTFVQSIIDKNGIVDYLTHEHEEDQYHYSKDDIVAMNLNEFLDTGSANDSSFEIIQDMLNGVPYRSLAYKYGRDFIYHYKQYKSVVDDIKMEELVQKNNAISQTESYDEFDFDVPMYESILHGDIE